MSITEELDGLDPIGLTAVIRGASCRLATKPLWSLSGGQTLELVRHLASAGASLDAARLNVLREVDTRGTAVADGVASTSAWLHAVGRQRPGAAKRDVAVAADLANKYAATAEALARGEVSLDHVEVICKILGALPDTVDDATVEAAQSHLLGLAREHDPATLAKLGLHLKSVIDPDGEKQLAAEEARMAATQELHLNQRDTGTWDVRGTLDPETGATLFAGLDVLAKPCPSTTDGRDPRSAATRRADALKELVELGMGAEGMPTTSGAAPTLLVTIPLATLEGRLGGAPATVEPHQHPMSAETARRLACEGKILPIVLGGDSLPLDVGRTRYAVPFHLRKAVLLRDNHRCAHPHCQAIARHIHHIVHWVHHGETVIHNLVALCGYHHRLVHHHDHHKQGRQPAAFTITAVPGGRPVFSNDPATQHMRC